MINIFGSGKFLNQIFVNDDVLVPLVYTGFPSMSMSNDILRANIAYEIRTKCKNLELYEKFVTNVC